MAVYRIFNGKKYRGFGTYYSSKRNAQAEAKKQRKMGRLVRVVKSPSPPDRPRSLQHYQIYVKLD